MRELTDEEVVEVLGNNGIGVLALNTEGGAPYPIPVAFGYDPGHDLLAFHLESGDDSDKRRHIAADPAGALTVYEETEPQETWRSVIVTGELSPVSYDEAEPGLARLAKNSQYAPNPVYWGASSERTPFELDIDDWSGREFTIA